MRKIFAAAAICGLALTSGVAMALPVNGTGNVTPGVIMGTGIGNGGWTGVTTQDGIEIALRAKLRFNLLGQPEDTFNYDGDRTYRFRMSDGNVPTNRSIFNFEWSINTDTTDTTDTPVVVLGDFTYLLEIDQDPTDGVLFTSIDPVFGKDDSAYGKNSTVNAKAEGTNGDGNSGGNSDGLRAVNNVTQNSQNLGFDSFSPDPDLPGIYTFNLSIFGDPLTQGGDPELLATTSIDVIVGVPEPGVLSLFGSGLALMGFLGWRNRRKQTS